MNKSGERILIISIILSSGNVCDTGVQILFDNTTLIEAAYNSNDFSESIKILFLFFGRKDTTLMNF